MPRDRAEYMREYRAKRKMFTAKGGPIVGVITPNEGEPIPFAGSATEVIADLSERILALSDEVARLRHELAARPAPASYEVTTEFSGGNVPRPFAEFRPVPKPGKGK